MKMLRSQVMINEHYYACLFVRKQPEVRHIARRKTYTVVIMHAVNLSQNSMLSSLEDSFVKKRKFNKNRTQNKYKSCFLDF